MTTVLLIRHGLCDPVGRSVAGRAPGTHLNAVGRAQVAALAGRLAGLTMHAVYSSPLERTMETATPIASSHHLDVVVEPDVIELDFGEWTGRELADLDRDERWRAFNAFRSGTRIPGGELMTEVQSRVVGAIERLARAHVDETIAVVSHGDVIRAALVYFLGMPLDLLQRLTIDPASVSVAHLDRLGAAVARINNTADWPPPAPDRAEERHEG